MGYCGMDDEEVGQGSTIESESHEDSTNDSGIGSDTALYERLETLELVVTEIRDQMVMSNQISAGIIFFLGVLFGVSLMKVFWNRLR